ncbi:caspase-3-like [Dendronephthya gigantea]|uniref:caspase-3-like n=1 Tax=Dendronephthya gigantea TaxID=151771 RepID=UPI00106A7537|nr:caspase-3-like [Dendronephthya gigantea]
MFCSCKNSCQKGTGLKRKGCPCKDKGVSCSDGCNCGTNIIECKNKVNKTPLVPNEEKTKPKLVGELTNSRVIDESDGDVSDEETAKSKQSTSSYLKKDTQSVYTIDRGYALVIHNKNFPKLRYRKGSEKDLEAIKDFCLEAGLKIDLIENKEVTDIRDHCQKITNADKNEFRNYDGFVCFISSHGNSAGIYGSYEKIISIDEIVSYFKECDELAGKPKLFFIQACRPIVSNQQQKEDLEKIGGDPNWGLCQSDASDIMIGHSTINGEYSCRDINEGSWFIQDLIKTMRLHAKTSHLMEIMTLVNKAVAEKSKQRIKTEQMPIQISNLRKLIHFKIKTV